MGPMFSGKTTELLKLIRKYKIANKKCLVINYNEDNRYNDL
jgi:thymidine kinase